MKTPKELYVTSREDRTNGATGFLHPHSNDKAGENRRATQDEWANMYVGLSAGLLNSYKIKHPEYVYITHQRVPVLDSNGVQTMTKWLIFGYKLHGQTEQIGEEYTEYKLGTIWQNEPLYGFRVVDTVTRYSTSNKLWLIHDPRGLTFEITTGCFQKLIMSTTIIKGVIQDKCVWISNKNLVCVTS